ncbi:MAG: hypothetical protein U0412_06080 [Nitrospira sp.]
MGSRRSFLNLPKIQAKRFKKLRLEKERQKAQRAAETADGEKTKRRR